MKNKEYYAKEIVDIVTSDDNDSLAINLQTKELCKCSDLFCINCLFHNPNRKCETSRHEWGNSEHVDPIKLTLAEKIILENLDKKFKWIARDKDGMLLCCECKPYKVDNHNMWFINWGIFSCLPFEHLLQFIKWEDEEPFHIEELLNNCEVIENVD